MTKEKGRAALFTCGSVIAAVTFYACASMHAEHDSVVRTGAEAGRADTPANAPVADAKEAPAAAAQAHAAGDTSEAIFKKYAPAQTLGAFEKSRAGQTDISPGAGLTPRPGEELWVIARAPAAATQPADAVSAPALRAKRPDGQEIPLPLKHTDVQASIAAYIASVHVTQQYHNPYAEKIEAVYVFPLPEDAAVSEFVMTIGDRHIRGIIRERQEAEQVYAEAKSQGYVASLLTQERPNIFTQSVANIDPGKAIDIELTYFNTLHYENGEYEFVFPMVVGPRFNPPSSTQGVGAVARGQRSTSGQATEVQYLAPNERSGHDIALAVDIDGGVAIESVSSPTHAIEVSAPAAQRRHIELSRVDTIPDKDFVLRYKVAGEAIKSGLLVHRDQRGGFFTLMLQPPADLAALPRAPMELVFVLDCSGSMDGYPIAKAKAALQRALRRLGPDDTFQVVRFSDHASQFGNMPVPATKENVERAISYVQDLNGEGGTMMIEGIKAALDFPHDPRRLRIVSFMTDGYIGNETEILGEIQQRLGAARIFSFGVGPSVNRYLLDNMARVGNGAVAYVGLDESSERAVDLFYERIAHPALTDIQVDWGGLDASEIYPQRVPDLFVGRPVILTGRFTGTHPATVTVRGQTAGRSQEIVLHVDPSERANTHAAIMSVWARMKIADLNEEALSEAEPASGEIKTVALEYGLMSAYTAFVAVDSAARTAGNHGTSVVQPVPVPQGVPYDTTVSDRTH